MKEIILKPSQFNYSSLDENGNMLLYNFAKGMASLCYVAKPSVDICKAILCGKKTIVHNGQEESINQLLQKGILVPQNTDELAKVETMFYETVLDSHPRLIIMPTEQCNFRCKYCYESYQKGKMNDSDQNALLKFIQRKITSSKKLQISWFGGEPLEAKDIVYRIMTQANNMCQKNNVQLISDMTTNAYNLNEETFDQLYRLRVYTYQITLDGLQEQHDQQRVLKSGEGTFNRIFQNLLYIKNNYHKYKFASILIRVNMSRAILEHLPEFIDFYRKNFGNDRRFSLGLTPISDMGGEIVKGIKNQFIDTSEIYNAINELDLYNDTSIQLANIMRALSPTESLCYASKKSTFVIGSDLTLYKCTVHFEMEENNIGKILPNGEPVIDANSHEKWYTKLRLKQCCKTCFMVPCCYGGGCPHKRIFSNESTEKCMLATWKSQIGHALNYVSKRINIEKINF